jgi:hypothetical protein
MDIQLPIIDGYTHSQLRSIPIIAVTSYALSGEEKKAREAGCDDYVPKPGVAASALNDQITGMGLVVGFLTGVFIVAIGAICVVGAILETVRARKDFKQLEQQWRRRQ